MFCKNCGKEIDEHAYVCPYCGVLVATPVPAVPDVPKKVNGLGIAGFVVSLISLGLGYFFVIASIVGLVLSIVGVCLRKKYTSCNGLAVAGLVIGIISTLIWTIVWIAVGATLALIF